MLPPDFNSAGTSITPETTNRNPGRLMIATLSTAFPTGISSIVNMSTFAAQAGWSDLGATKGGVTVSFNNTEQELTVDQIGSAIQTIPDDSTMTVSTNLAESTLDHLSVAWEGDVVQVNVNSGYPNEKQTGFGPFDTYTQRRLAVGDRNALSGKLRFFCFRIAQRAPQDSSMVFNSDGDQQQIPVSFRILPDTSIATLRQRFGLGWHQQ